MENETTGSEVMVTDIKSGYSVYENVIPHEYLTQFQNYYNPNPKPKQHSKSKSVRKKSKMGRKSRKINRNK